MDNVNIVTSQNVLVSYTIASIGERLVAAILDYVILFAYAMVILVAYQSGGIDPDWVFAVLVGVPFGFYHLVCEIFLNGQSLGKLAMRIKVVREDGGEPSIIQYVIRALFRVLEVMTLIGVPVMVLNAKGQRIGDILARTLVVNLRRKVSLDETLLDELPEDYVPMFPQVTELNDKQVALIKEVLGRNSSRNQFYAMDRLRQKVTTKLKISSDGMASGDFLQRIVDDYLYYTSRG